MRRSIKRSIKSNIKVQITGSNEAVEFAVSNQSISRGALTLTGAAAHTFTASTGTINSIGTVTGLNAADWTISYSSNTVTCSPSGDGLANGPYSLTIPCYPEAAQGGTPVNVTFSCSTIADTYTVSPADTGSGVVAAVENAATKTLTTDYTVDLLAGEYTGSVQITGDVFSGAVTDANAGVPNASYNRSARGTISGGSVHITCASAYGAEFSGAVDFVGSGPFRLTNLDFSLVASLDGYNRDDGGPQTNTTPNSTTKQLQHRITGTFPTKTDILIQDCRFGGASGGSPNARYPYCVDIAEAGTAIIEDCFVNGFYLGLTGGSCERLVIRRNETREQIADAIRCLGNRAADMVGSVVRFECLDNTILDLVDDPDWNGAHADGAQEGTGLDEVSYDNYVSKNYIYLTADQTPNAWGYSRKSQGFWWDDSGETSLIDVEQNGEISQNIAIVTTPNGLGLWNTADGQGALVARNNTFIHATDVNVIGNSDPWIRTRGSGSPAVIANINGPQGTIEGGTPVIFNNASIDHDAQSPDANAYPEIFAGPFVYDATRGQTFTLRTDTVANFRADCESVFADKVGGAGEGLGFLNLYTGAAPSIVSTVPADDAIDVDVDTSITIVFDQVLYPKTGNISIYDSSDDSLIEAFDIATEQGAGAGQVEVSGNTIVLRPTSNFANSQGVYVNINSTCFEDYFGNNFAGISDKTTLNFTVIASGFVPQAVDNQGTAYLSYGTSPSPDFGANSAVGILSVFLKPNGTLGTTQIFDSRGAGGNTLLELKSASSQRLTFTLRNAGSATTLVTGTTAANTLIADTWNHVVMAWDFSTASFKFYLNDVAATYSNAPSPISGTIDWSTGSRFGLCATSTGSSISNMGVADFYLNTQQTLDIDNVVNRRLFRTALGKQANLGSNGETPTGVSPAFYFGNPASTFEVNLGSGGGVNKTGTFIDTTTP